ncbi:MAG: AAA family ATPase [Ilumatobacter sp.]|uniref:AAA family ATPase n=1 Tax=Ilumatobacter sp. TaxID=1967498 RepID=UPI00262FE664|nr:AAA family ATPase [Ilumatobacter sp.]MDJ0771475.1 AAA family ATPase [Ilumatobacter sp.]
MAGPLATYVDAFVDGANRELRALSGDDHRHECAVEAGDLVSAILASDGRLTTSELEAWLTDIGPRLDPPVSITPQRLRDSDLITAKASWASRPSTMYDLLVRADARDGGRRSHTYYEHALKLAHAAAALDLMPSPDEIAAIDDYRTMLLTTMNAFGVPGPGQAGRSVGAGRRPATTTPEPEPELPPERPVDELLAELDALIGLDHVKAEVRRLTSLLRVQRLRAEHDLPVIETSRHLVFVGNPGTGKTTVARLLSQIYRSLDVVSKGHLVETDRSGLVAGYVGQTATKTRAVLDAALGGTVLIDEAYALARGGENDFGLEAIDTLVKFMEDHRDDLAVVVAGYPAEMQELIETNPGLDSRFARTLEFPDYTSDELVAIFELISAGKEYHLDDDARARLREVIEAEPRGRGFGNARFTRNVFEHAVALHALRLAEVERPTPEQLTTLVAADLEPI